MGYSQTNRCCSVISAFAIYISQFGRSPVPKFSFQRKKQINRQTDRETGNMHLNRQTDKHTGKQTGDRQTYEETYRKSESNMRTGQKERHTFE